MPGTMQSFVVCAHTVTTCCNYFTAKDLGICTHTIEKCFENAL